MVPILFIAYYFPPIGGAGVQRSVNFVRCLSLEGFTPVVLTGPGDVEDRWAPSDSTPGDVLPCDVQILRAPRSIPRRNGTWTSRLNRWLGALDPFSSWWIEAATQVASQSVGNTKLIFATMSPFATANIASQISARTGIPWIADLRDPWALDEMQIFPSGFHRMRELKRMGQLLSTASGIVMNTPEAAAALHEAFPSFAEKPVTTITNGYTASDFSRPVVAREDGKFRIVHTGYLHTELGTRLRRRRDLYQWLGGIEAGLDILTRSHVVLLEAIEQWIARRPEVGKDLEIIFAGVISDNDRSVASNSAVSSFVKFSGYVSHSESVQLIRTADLLFLPMHNLPVGKRSRIVPGKTYEYMATGRPILAAVPNGDARDFLQKSGVAFVCEPSGVQTMVEQLDRVYLTWKSGVPAVSPDWEFIKKFERSMLAQQLARFFNQVLQMEKGTVGSRNRGHTAN